MHTYIHTYMHTYIRTCVVFYIIHYYRMVTALDKKEQVRTYQLRISQKRVQYIMEEDGSWNEDSPAKRMHRLVPTLCSVLFVNVIVRRDSACDVCVIVRYILNSVCSVCESFTEGVETFLFSLSVVLPHDSL